MPPTLRPPALVLEDARLVEVPEHLGAEEALEFALVQGIFIEGSFQDTPRGAPLKECLARHAGRARTPEEKAACADALRALTRDLGALFEAARRGDALDGREVGKLARRVIGLLLADRELLLVATLTQACAPVAEFPGLFYLPCHAVRVAALTADLAITLGYGDAQVYELAHGALLADVGMTQVPRAVFEKAGKLTAAELREVQRHPLHSIAILKRAGHLPFSTLLVAYQSHERGDRSGYPRGRAGKLLHRFSRILAVADTYCAAASHRAHRPARLPHTVLAELLAGQAGRKLDPECLQGLARSLGLYPLGSWVRLASGESGRVVGIPEGHHDLPLVRTPAALVDLSAPGAPAVAAAIPPPAGMEDPLAGI